MCGNELRIVPTVQLDFESHAHMPNIPYLMPRSLFTNLMSFYSLILRLVVRPKQSYCMDIRQCV